MVEAAAHHQHPFLLDNNKHRNIFSTTTRFAARMGTESSGYVDSVVEHDDDTGLFEGPEKDLGGRLSPHQ
jgi:hypothetical protein